MRPHNAPPPRRQPGRADVGLGGRTGSDGTAVATERPAPDRLVDADARLDSVAGCLASSALGLVDLDAGTLTALVALVDAARSDVRAHRVTVAQQ